MTQMKFGMVLAVKEHLLSGHSMTQLEAIVLFGVPSLTKVISDMRRDGFVVESRRVPYAAALKRINEHATLVPPANLPVREVQLTEYWVSQ
jgi:hypothetical protein